jgi:hypothetical protein
MDQLPSARREGLIVESLGDELLVYDGERNRAHSLNGVAAAVWEACDGKRSACGLAEAASEKLGESVSEEAVWRALAQLDERRLLVGESAHGYSRRQAVKRMTVMGATAAFAAPLVKSIVVPTAAEAGASCVPEGSQCGNNNGEGCDTATFPPCCPATGINCNPVSDTNRCECNSSTF